MADFEDSGWGIERRTTYRPRRITLATKTVAVVGIGLTCALVVAIIAQYRAEVASAPSMQVPNSAVRRANEPSASSAEETKRQELRRAALDQQAREHQAEQLRAVNEAKQAALEQRESEQRAQQQRSSDAASEVLDEKTRKEQAWAKFYKRPAYCDHDPTNEQTIKCANDFIRAQRQFHEAYTAGKL